MGKETLGSQEEIPRLVTQLKETFMQRQDLYARQRNDGSYLCIRKPLHDGLIHRHLLGKTTLGAYILNQESEARFLVFDADDQEAMEKLKIMAKALDQDNVPTYFESSRRGGHLWLFLRENLPGKEVRRFGAGLLAYHGIEDIELFPKQERIFSGPGSLIRLPFGVHRKSGKRYGFYDALDRPLAPTLREQIRILANRHTVPQAVFTHFHDYAVEREADLLRVRPRGSMEKQIMPKNGAFLSEKIKSAVPLREFIDQYVPLSPRGLGQCPFHEDNVASFSVHEEENYWHCFACGIGGSIIDFWMHWKNCGFKTALAELASILYVDIKNEK